MRIRCYSELITLPTFEERFEYLQMKGRVGEETFGWERYLNQSFYRTEEWRRVRDYVIVRDKGCDLGVSDREIYSRILVHHINPITKSDILNKTKYLLDPEYLICTQKATHDAIHYSDKSLLVKDPIERRKGDTCLWKRNQL